MRLIQPSREAFLSWNLIADLLLSTAKIVVPAILIALIGQAVILSWQHKYWRLQKITAPSIDRRGGLSTNE